MNPNYIDFHRSIAAELEAVKNRVCSLVDHWGEDGAHKEAVLRAVLSRHLPQTLTVGTGLIVGPEKTSTQIDILIVDSSKPTLFRDGNLIFVTPDAVKAVVEVKANLENANIAETVAKLARVSRLCPKGTWTGLFGYEKGQLTHDAVLKALQQAEREEGRAINAVCGGPSDFFLRWDASDMSDGPAGSEQFWRSYGLESLAPSYFLGNLVYGCGNDPHQVGNYAWFPIRGEGKEMHRKRQIGLGNGRPTKASL